MEMKFTIGELNLLINIYNQNGKTTLKEQQIYNDKGSFYSAMGNLKKHGFITTEYLIVNTKRLCIYHLTLKGLNLVHLICGFK